MSAGSVFTEPDVVIIGAGAAGIAAARTLIDAGRTVLVLEADHRIGGRAWTETESFGVPFDQGCAWLQGPASLPYAGFAATKGFSLIDHSDPPSELFVDARKATLAEHAAYEDASGLLRELIDRSKADVAVSALFNAADPWSRAAATWLGPMDHSVDIDQLSAADVRVYGVYDTNCLVKEGLGALVAAFGQGLPIRTGAAVTAIDWSGQDVRVQTALGDVRAKFCIVTVSAGVLASGRIRFTPSLPAVHQNALDGLPMGLLCKIALEIEGTRFGLPDNAFLTRAVPEDLPARAAFFLSFAAGMPICVGFAGGSMGWDIERAGEPAAIDFAVAELTKMLGSGVRQHVRRGCMTNWGANPLTRGAYVAARPGHHGNRRAFEEPLAERVFFAGEALGGAYPALLSGAHISGVSAARAILAAREPG